MFPDLWKSDGKSEEDHIAIEEALKEALGDYTYIIF
jgi:hypothetical protein